MRYGTLILDVEDLRDISVLWQEAVVVADQIVVGILVEAHTREAVAIAEAMVVWSLVMTLWTDSRNLWMKPPTKQLARNLRSL
jgi:hypothetical protein